MSHKAKHWGEIEDGVDDDESACLPKANLDELIEAALQPDLKGDTAGRCGSSTVTLPVDNITLQTVRLLEHNRKVAEAVAGGEVPPSPPLDALVVPDKFDDKIYDGLQDSSSDREIPTLTAADRKKALVQAVALILMSRPGLTCATRSVLDTLADAADNFLRTVTSTMRTVVDKEAAGHPSGFADVMNKVFTELGITGLSTWYRNHVVAGYKQAQRGIEEVPVVDVPQLHFPASLEELSDSLGPGFQMLHTLESGQLPALNLLDGDSDNLELNDALVDDESPPDSPTVRKKRKLNSFSREQL